MQEPLHPRGPAPTDRTKGKGRKKAACLRCQQGKRACTGTQPCVNCEYNGVACVFIGGQPRPASAARGRAGREGSAEPVTGDSGRSAGTAALPSDVGQQNGSGVPAHAASFARPTGRGRASHLHYPRSPFPELPATTFTYTMLDRFFRIAEQLAPALHRKRFYDRWPPSALLVSAMMLFAPIFDPVSANLVLMHYPSIRTFEKITFIRIRMELNAALEQGYPQKDGSAAAVVAPLIIGAWAFYRELYTLAQSMSDLAAKVVSIVGWRTGKNQPAARFRDMAKAAFGPDVFERQLSQREVSALRDLWIEYVEQHRTVSILSVSLHARRDLFREPAKPEDFDLTYRPVQPPLSTWEASMDPGFDPRTAGTENEALISDTFGWVDSPSGAAARQAALNRLPSLVLSFRSTLHYIHAKLRSETDAFLATCKAAGLSPGNLSSRPDLAATRLHIDSCLQDALHWLPPPMKAAWMDSDPARMMQILSSCGIPSPLNKCCNVASMALMRAELWSGLGLQFAKEFDGDANEALDRIGDEFLGADDAQRIAQVLQGARRFTRFYGTLVSQNPVMNLVSGTQISSIVSATVLHAALARRLRAKGVAGEFLDETEKAVEMLLNALGALAARLSGHAMRALEFVTKLVAGAQVEPGDIKRLRLEVDGEAIEDE